MDPIDIEYSRSEDSANTALMAGSEAGNYWLRETLGRDTRVGGTAATWVVTSIKADRLMLDALDDGMSIIRRS